MKKNVILLKIERAIPNNMLRDPRDMRVYLYETRMTVWWPFYTVLKAMQSFGISPIF